jgi:glyceraldehyde 3-phosphate dehydrogenase
MNGLALRVPTPTVSLVDLVVTTEKPVTKDAINGALREAANGRMKGFLRIEDDPCVSVDFVGDPASSIVDADQTMVLGDKMAKVMSWYDNEWAYSCRVGDLIVYMAEKGF